jgi:hypothetical protein
VQAINYVLSNITLTENDNPPPSASNVAKRLPAAADFQEAQMKQAVDGKLKPFTPVVNQTVVTNSMCCKKVIMMVALPGNVMSRELIIVEYAPGSNGGGLLIWIPRRQVTSNTDKLKVVLSKIGNKGVTESNAILFAQALEAKLMDK